MTTKTTFFMAGVTGYIGGTVLERFLSHPNASSFHITALVRSSEKAEKLKKFGVEPILGSLSDLQLLEDSAANADAVVAMADCDDLRGAEATLRGIKRRFEQTGKAPVFINTSGTGVLSDNSGGLKATETIYDDLNPDQIETLPITQIHRPVDLAIVNADKEGYAKTYIILPSTVYGLSSGRLADAGIHNRQSIQVPSLISASLDRGRAGMVGEGKNLWPNVEIHDQADLYLKLYDAIVDGKNPALGHGREGFYFGASGEHLLYDLSLHLGAVLVELGKATEKEPTSFTKEEMAKYFGSLDFLGSNSRCVVNRSKAIGWAPKKTTKDLFASLKPGVEMILKTGYSPSFYLL
ncbi:uncharacterized protein EV420DRAFT_1203380 [Desarmillaria tabescens]|uniref:NmrA-like domain-containing protein n=1 Tax=Armillaria tabescens TaxID=1929756 RepID=A0AA39JA72_ARMTA|nr:uncharacterized protein EV420DRAFT_1203380 [Desarmillaria tabescens]KAK0439027.1 hypothetical protein EV420DRAFT_1203380 [Desarmillaria tabescens]